MSASVNESVSRTFRHNAWGLTTLSVLATFVLGWLICSAPLTALLGRFMPDDVFYYYNTARHLATIGRSTFDGIHFTNGYQPLWFLMCTPIFTIFPEGGEIPIRVMMGVQLVLSMVATGLLVWTMARYWGILASAAATLVWLTTTQSIMLNGLETALMMCTYGLLFFMWLSFRSKPYEERKISDYAAVGAVAGLLFLCRTDTGFLLAAIGAGLFFERHPWSAVQLRRLTAFALAAGILVAPYLLYNFLETGHFMPVSGAAKVFHSQMQREEVIRAGASPIWVRLENLFWAFHNRHAWYILAGVFGPWALLLVSLFRPTNRLLTLVRHAWPFFAGATAAWLFYGLVFYGSFTRTLWYYGPHAFLASMVIAALDRSLQSTALFRRAPGVPALCLAGWLLQWLRWEHVLTGLLVGAVLSAAAGWRSGEKAPRPFKTAWLAGGAVMIFTGLLLLAAEASMVQVWRGMALLAIILSILWPKFFDDRHAELWCGVSVILVGCCIHAKYLVHRLREDNRNWGYNLYLGAMWAKDHLPADAVIWSGSSGILGYFSERKVVNTDGLANDFDFLENYLKKGRLIEYFNQWDYTIDAFPDDDLAVIFPRGRFIPLPPEYQQFSFSDGSLTRMLRVFQRDHGDQPAWPPEPRFDLTGPQGGRFLQGETITITWQARDFRKGSTISLCYDADAHWDTGNETWITIDGIAVVSREGEYRWDTSSVPPGTYYLGGYLHDGRSVWKLSRLTEPIELVAGGAGR